LPRNLDLEQAVIVAIALISGHGTAVGVLQETS